MALQKYNLQTQIEKLLKDSQENYNQKIKVLKTILFRLQGNKQSILDIKCNKREFNFRQMDTESQQIQLFRLEKSPVKRTNMNIENSFDRDMPINQENQSHSQTNMHRLSSQIKGFLFQSSQKKNENRKLKKIKIVELINKTNECINTLCESLNKTYSHLLASRMGKAVKFQAESIYLTHLKNILQETNKKLAQKMKTENLIQFYCESVIYLKNQISKYQNKFILPQEQLNIPQPSKLFRIIVQ